jgi:hypothetical protein
MSDMIYLPLQHMTKHKVSSIPTVKPLIGMFRMTRHRGPIRELQNHFLSMEISLLPTFISIPEVFCWQNRDSKSVQKILNGGLIAR